MKILTVGVLCAAAALGTAGVAQADGDEHNCAGAASSALATGLPPGVFGEIVAGAAQAQQVDNFGLANCGDTDRQNP